MKVERLTLRNFRNITECSFDPDPHLNFLVGANGQGKTSFLEALGYFATLRSFRGSKTPEVVRWEEEGAEILCSVVPGEEGFQDWRTELKIVFSLEDSIRARASKIAFINGKPYKSSTQYLSQRFGHFELGFHTVIFNPADHDLVRGEPSVRRAYLDRVLAAEDVEYLKTFQKYQKVLQHRNALLKSGDRSFSGSRESIAGFTDQLVGYGSILTLKRLGWIHRLRVFLNDTVRSIAPEQPFLSLVYLSNWVPNIEGLCIPNNDLGSINFAGHGELPSLELLEQSFWNRVSLLDTAEWKAGHSLVGPHRDDWTFLMGNQVLKGHGSQGEVRSALLALKLCEIELFRNETGHRPLFLLDDFSSELDRERRSFLLRFLSETDLQVFVTTTESSSLAGKKYRVVHGQLEKAESPKDFLPKDFE